MRSAESRVPQPPGPATPADFPAARTGQTAPAVTREAAAPRRWTSKGLAAAVICVVLGGLVVMVGVRSFSTRQTVLVVARSVSVGSTLVAADLTTARITADASLRPVPATARTSVLGQVAMVDLRPGTLITRQDIGTSDGFTAGQVLVALPLKQGQFPARGLVPGEHVLVTPTHTPSGTNGPVATTRAVVTEVGATDPTTGLTVADVRVPAASGTGVAQLAATGALAVIALPAGG